MRIRDRDIRRIARAPFSRQHWRALGGIFRTFERPIPALARYLGNGGTYPWAPVLRTPTGNINPTLTSYHDLLTINEVFCRRDYGNGDGETIVDIGANVGLAALYFLTRNTSSRIWCFEPDPLNLARLHDTLHKYEHRVTVIDRAVTPQPCGPALFVSAGRYGHISTDGGIEVQTVDIGAALREISATGKQIDLVKIDVEGLEEALVAAIPNDLSISRIVYEDNHGRTRWVV